MKHRSIRIIFVVIIMTLFIGCYLPSPSEEDVSMSTFSLMSFIILSNTAENFEWYVDDELQVDENKKTFLFFPMKEGSHIIEVTFTDGLMEKSHVWYVSVDNG